MKLINCPDSILDLDLSKIDSPIVFLAGGITGCPDWQKEMIELLSGEDVMLLNPRRKDFDASDPTMERAQITWEFKHIEIADAMIFWFPEETVCPITLYELGRAAALGVPLYVGCHPNYKRKRDVEIQLELAGYKEPIRGNLQDLAKDIIKDMKLVLLWLRS